MFERISEGIGREEISGFGRHRVVSPPLPPGFDSNSRTVPPGAPGGQAQRDFPSSSLTTRCMAIKAHGDARSLGGGLTLCCELLFDEGLDPLLIARLDVQKLDADSLSFDAVSDNCLTGNLA